MFTKPLFIVAAVAFALSSSCATIVSKNTYPVTVNSYPAGATFKVKNSRGQTLHHGKTPSTVTLKASDGFFKAAEYNIEVRSAKGKIVNYPITASVDGWYAGNILFGGLIGILVIDPATGNMWSLPESVHITLEQSSTAGLTIMTLDAVAKEQHDKLVPIS